MTTNSVRVHPTLGRKLVEIADKLERAGHNTTAAELLEVAANLMPQTDGLRARAAKLRRAGGSAEEFEREHKKHNLEASHAVGMARVFEHRGELGRAQEMLDLAKLRAPFHYLAYAGAGYMHLRRRDLRAALEEFVQARRLNPLDRKLAVESARVALELEDYTEALRHAVDALLLGQGMERAEEIAARRRVDTLAGLCRMNREEVASLQRQRATALQRAAEQVALTRARLFSALAVGEAKPGGAAMELQQDDLLRTALELRRFRSFRHFTDPQLLQLVQASRRERFRHAQPLTREGEEGRDVFVLLEGKVQACRRTPLGMRVVTTLGVGEVVGEISYLDGKPRSSTLIGLESGSVLRFPASFLEALSTVDNDLSAALLWAFFHALSGKVRAANAAMTELIAPGTTAARSAGPTAGEQLSLDPSSKLDVLKEQGLSNAELRLLAIYSREERFQPGDLIFGEGQHGDKLYIVMDGQVRISRRLQGVGEEALTILGRGEVFGEMALIDSQPRSADAVAHTEGCTVFTVDRQRLEEVLGMDPDAARQFLTLLCQLLCRRIRAMNDRLVAWWVMAGTGS